MTGKFKYWSCCIVLFLIISTVNAENNIKAENKYTFSDNERLVFTGAYSLGFIYTEVAQIDLKLEKMQNPQQQYRIVGKANTYKFYDKIYKIRYFFESKFVNQNITTQYFYRDINENGYTKTNTYWFDWDNKKISGYQQTKSSKEDFLLKMEPGIDYSDVLTSFYKFRNQNFTRLEPNQSFTFSFVLDNEFFSIQCKFLGREVRKAKYLNGSIPCMKFNLEVVSGSVFKGDEMITVWMTDDQNHVPIEMECPIRVGRIRAYLKSYENLKYPLAFSTK